MLLLKKPGPPGFKLIAGNKYPFLQQGPQVCYCPAALSVVHLEVRARMMTAPNQPPPQEEANNAGGWISPYGGGEAMNRALISQDVSTRVFVSAVTPS